MSGRGRGRGRGRGAPLSQSKVLLKRSAVEAGLDEQHAVNDLTRPRLYADFLWHSSGDPSSLVVDPTSNTMTTDSTPLQVTKRSASTRHLVSKQREFMERFAASPHFVKVQQTADIIRSKSSHHHHHHQFRSPDQTILESIGKKLANDERYIPLELGPNRLAKSTQKANASALLRANSQKTVKTQNLEALAEKEQAKGGGGTDKANTNGEEEEEEDDDGLLAEDPLEEEGADDDYMQDYYASDDNDSDGGGDGGEPVF